MSENAVPLPPNPKQIFGDKKPPLDEFPLTALIEASLAHLDGDLKYGFRNWLDLPVEARTYIKGALRHIQLWANGEERARDGAHNLGHAIAGLAILIDAQANSKLIDNRKKSQAACDRLHEAEADVAMLNAMARVREDLKAGLITANDAKEHIARLAREVSSAYTSPPAPSASPGADTTVVTPPAPEVVSTIPAPEPTLAGTDFLHEDPAPVEAPAPLQAPEPIPVYIYHHDGNGILPGHVDGTPEGFYSVVHDEIVCVDSEGPPLNDGDTIPFWAKWQGRRAEFPTLRSRLL